MARDNWTLSCAEPAIWQLMDHLTRQYYIDPDRIYGSGQSMGGMTIMAMAAQRDNYFAALLPMSCKWGNNFNKDYPFNGTAYYNMPADGTIVWQKDSHGNPVNYNNWFYMVSDDNILYLNTAQENTEYRVLYQDLAGVTIPGKNSSSTAPPPPGNGTHPSASSPQGPMKQASTRPSSPAASAICPPGSTATAHQPATNGC